MSQFIVKFVFLDFRNLKPFLIMINSILVIPLSSFIDKSNPNTPSITFNYDYILFKNYPQINGGGFVSHFDLVEQLKALFNKNEKERKKIHSSVWQSLKDLSKNSYNAQMKHGSVDKLHICTFWTSGPKTLKSDLDGSSSEVKAENYLIAIVDGGVCFVATISTSQSAKNSRMHDNYGGFQSTVTNDPQNQQRHLNHASNSGSIMDQFSCHTVHDSCRIGRCIEFLREVKNQYFHLASTPSIDIKSYMYMYISQACINGTISQPNMFHAHHLLTKPFQKAPTMLYPSWKPPLQYKSRNFIHCIVRENYIATYYDKTGVLNPFQAYGTIMCTSDIDLPRELTLTVSNSNRIDNANFVSSVQVSNIGSDSNDMTLRFIPMSASYTLCKYDIKLPSQDALLPIRGFFQQKRCDVTKIQLLLQLKLSSEYKNSLEFLRVELPFTVMHSPIKSTDALEPSQGKLSMSPNRDVLIWELGSQITDPNLECTLSGILLFEENKTITSYTPTNTSTLNRNYAKVTFKLINSTLSGVKLHLNTSNIGLNTRISEEICSSSIIIWNSLCD